MENSGKNPRSRVCSRSCRADASSFGRAQKLFLALGTHHILIFLPPLWDLEDYWHRQMPSYPFWWAWFFQYWENNEYWREVFTRFGGEHRPKQSSSSAHWLSTVAINDIIGVAASCGYHLNFASRWSVLISLCSGRKLHASSGPHESVRPHLYIVSVPITYPSICSRMQTLGPIKGDPSKRFGTFAVIRYSIAKEGVRSLYTGLSASLLRQMTYSLVRIGIYEEMKRRMVNKGQTPSTGKLLLAAGVAGGLGGLAGNPAGEFGVESAWVVYWKYFTQISYLLEWQVTLYDHRKNDMAIQTPWAVWSVSSKRRE